MASSFSSRFFNILHTAIVMGEQIYRHIKRRVYMEIERWHRNKSINAIMQTDKVTDSSLVIGIVWLIMKL